MSTYLGKPSSYWKDLIVSVNPERSDPSESNETAYSAAIEHQAGSNEKDLSLLTIADPALLPMFAEFLQDDDWWIRHFAVGMLAQFGSHAKTLVELIIPLLKVEEHFLNRRQAADTLGAIGSEAKAAISVLQTLLDEEDVSEWAEAALKQIQHQ